MVIPLDAGPELTEAMNTGTLPPGHMWLSGEGPARGCADARQERTAAR